MNWEKLLFWFSLLVAFCNGEVIFSASSSMSSDSLKPQTEYRAEWTSADGDETLFVIYNEDGLINTGP